MKKISTYALFVLFASLFLLITAACGASGAPLPLEEQGQKREEETREETRMEESESPPTAVVSPTVDASEEEEEPATADPGTAVTATADVMDALGLVPPPIAPTPVAISVEMVATAIGDPGAPVTIVEFTDYQCPFCQRHAEETMPQIISELVETGEVYYLIKDLPLDGIHPYARAAAVAARCAGEQEAYMEMHDALFASQTAWSTEEGVAEEVFLGLAEEVGLDRGAFESCLGDGRYDDLIQANVDEATSLGVQSTPSFFINGFPIRGAQPFELFTFAVELAREGTLADAYVPPQPQATGAHAIGNPDAPVVMIEFTDYQCPFCSRYFSQTLPKIKENFIDTGQVYYVFKDFPITNIHPQAVKAAEAARCAGDQDNYLGMHDLLFENQEAWSGRTDAPDLFVSYAEELGLDIEQFQGCLNSGQHEAAVYADLEEGQNAGVRGTPAFYINGYALSGAQPYGIFEQAINYFLKGS